MIGEVAGENRREMHLAALCRVGPDDRPGEFPGERLQLRTQFGRRRFEKHGDHGKVRFAPSGEGLHRIENGTPGESFGDGRDRHASGRVGHRSLFGNRERCGHLRHGAIADGDQVDVGILAEHFGARLPAGRGQLRNDARPLGVAGENLHEFQFALGDGAGQRFREVPAADDDGFFQFRIHNYSRSVSRTLSCDRRADSLSVSSSRSMRASSGVCPRSKVVCPDRSTASSTP